MVEIITLNLRLNDAKLLVIDAQNDVCDSNSDYANSAAPDGAKRDVIPIQEAIEKGIIPLLAKAREHELPIGFVQSIYQPGQYSDVSPKWLTIDDDLDDPEWRIKIYRDMPKQGEPIFRKDTQNTFTYQSEENGLGDWLQNIPYVLVTGFVSYGCVKECVNALLERHYIPVVLEDCIGASAHRKAEHNAALNDFKKHDIIQLVNSKNIKF